MLFKNYMKRNYIKKQFKKKQANTALAPEPKNGCYISYPLAIQSEQWQLVRWEHRPSTLDSTAVHKTVEQPH